MYQFLSLKCVFFQPFFLATGFHKPHIPFKFPKEYLQLYPYSEIDLAPNPFIPLGLPSVAYAPFAMLRKRHDVMALNLSFPFAHVPDDFQVSVLLNKLPWRKTVSLDQWFSTGGPENKFS